MNVLGDSFGAGIVDHMSRADLTKIDNARMAMEEEREEDDVIENNNFTKNPVDSHVELSKIV